MSTTISWLLQQTLIPNFSLLAGDTDYDIQISGINIMDNPDTTPWLTSGALILSTGYFFTDIELTQNLIQELYDKGCAGLGIKMNRYLSNLPDHMIEQANSLHFPIFSIPFSNTMDQIANLVYRKLYEDELGEAERFTLIYKECVDCVLKKGSISTLLSIIGSSEHASILLTNDNFDLLGTYLSSTAPYTSLLNNSLTTLFSKADIIYLKNNYESTHAPYITHTFNLLDTNIPAEIYPITNKHKLLGYLILIQDNAYTNSYDFITNIQTAISLSLLNHSILTESERSSKDIFFQYLLTGQCSLKQEIELLCIQNNFEFSKNRICIVIHIPEYESLTIPQRRAFERKIFANLETLFDKYPFSISKTVFQTHFVLFISLEDSMVLKQTTDFVISFANECCFAIQSLHLKAYAGISKVSNGALSIQPSYKQALQALEIGIQLAPVEIVHSYYKNQIYHNLLNNFTNQELSDLYREHLGPLELYDQQNESTLSDTLKTYIESGCISAQAAKKLYIHRNTMSYRLEQIRDILHISLDNSDDIYNLQTCYYIQKIQKIVQTP